MYGIQGPVELHCLKGLTIIGWFWAETPILPKETWSSIMFSVP